MCDVCLVYTNTDTQGRLGTHVFDVLLPPLGLAYLGAALEEKKYTVEIIDAFAEGISDQELLSRLMNRFRIVGFYCHTQNYYSILQMAKTLKQAKNSPYIVVGGPHPTAFPKECFAAYEQIDCSVFGEGEITLVELAARLLNNKTVGEIKGIAYRKNGAVIVNQPRELIEDLDSLPMPAWHLLPMKKYRSLIEARGKKIMHIIGSRGCFNDCNYCFSSKMWGKRVRWHSPERVLKEIDHLKSEYKIRFFQFFDDNFTLKHKRLKILMKAFKLQKLNWCCSTRIDLLNEEIVQQLKYGGVDHVAIGIETIHDKLLKIIGKNITFKQIERTLNICKKYRMSVFGMFIFGIPEETEDQARETIAFACKSSIYFAVFSCMTMYPGTNFFHMYQFSPYACKNFSQFNLSKEFSFVYKNRTAEELNKTIQRAYLKFYSRPKIVLWLIILMLKNLGKLLEMIIAFCKILFGFFNSLLRKKSLAA